MDKVLPVVSAQQWLLRSNHDRVGIGSKELEYCLGVSPLEGLAELFEDSGQLCCGLRICPQGSLPRAASRSASQICVGGPQPPSGDRSLTRLFWLA